MIGERLSHYKILELLGSGGMGVVYRAMDENLGREVAIKILHKDVMHDPERIARFEREAKAIAKLAHPNILAIHEFGRERGIVFAVTELLEGETLGKRLTHERLHWRKALTIAASIADGLAAAHSKGIIHRDIKPENIFLTSDGRVKILDFGLAHTNFPQVEDPMATTLTVSGMGGEPVMGTVAYMAPEQLRNTAVDARTDIFTFGCVLFEMLTGQRAFHRGSFAMTVTAILMDPAPELHMSGLDTTIELNRIIGRCLEKNPGERFQSASDLAFTIRAQLGKSHLAPSFAEEVPSERLDAPPPRINPFPSAARRQDKVKLIPRLILPLALAVCALAIAAALWPGKTSESALAVLPFENPNMDNSGLGDRLAERITATIRELDIIKMKPLQARQAYEGKELDYPAIAKRLQVSALLKGKYRQVGEDLEIYLELIDGKTGDLKNNYAFSEKPLRVMENIAGIARSVVEQLRPSLSPDERDRLDCQASYGKGRDELDKRNPESLRRAIAHFDDALQKNPQYALAHVGKADCYNLLGIYGVDDPREVFPLGKQAAEEALKIDNSLAEAHTSLAFELELYELDRQAARREYDLAIRLGSSKADARAAAYHRYGVFLLTLGQYQESINNIRRAQAANPFSQIIMTDLAAPYLYSGDLDTAIRICDEAIARFPSFAPAYRYRSLAFEQKGDYVRAIKDLELAVNYSGKSPLMRSELGHVYASSGNRDRATGILSELLEQKKTGYRSSFRIAQIEASLGAREAALKNLENAFEEKDPFLSFLEIDPILRVKLGEDLRYKKMREYMATR